MVASVFCSLLRLFKDGLCKHLLAKSGLYTKAFKIIPSLLNDTVQLCVLFCILASFTE